MDDGWMIDGWIKVGPLFRVVGLICSTTPEVIIYVVSDVNPTDRSCAPHSPRDSTWWLWHKRELQSLIPCKIPETSRASSGARDQARHISGYPRKRLAFTKNESRLGL